MLFKVEDLDPVDPGNIVTTHEAKCLKYISEMVDKDLSAAIPELVDGWTYHYDVNHRWSIHDIVIHCIKLIGPCKVYLSMYAIKNYQAGLLTAMHSTGAITELHALLDYRVPTHDADAATLMESNCSSIGYVRTHSKLVVLQNENFGVTLVGSANLTTNTRLDVGVITVSQEVAAARIKWITNFITENNGTN